MSAYLGELSIWAERVNLVGSRGPQELALHVRDSVAPADRLLAGQRVVDLGSGAGLPGLPLAIVRDDVSVSLVEVRERRVHFLRHVIRKLELDVEVRRVRIEEPGEADFDIACLRAVGPPADVVPLAAGWVRPGGQIWLWSALDPAELSHWDARELVVAERGRVIAIPADAAR